MHTARRIEGRFSGISWLIIAACLAAAAAWAVSRVDESYSRGLFVGEILLLVTAVLFWLGQNKAASFDPFFLCYLSAKVLLMGNFAPAIYLNFARTYDGWVSHGNALEFLGRYPEIQRFAAHVIPVFGESGSSNLYKFLAVLYRLSFPDFVVGHVWFSFFGALSLYCYYWSLRLAFPEAEWKLPITLIAFSPTVLLYSSLILKDAPTFLSLGLLFLGMGRCSRRAFQGGLPVAALGLLGLMIFRPHMLILATLAITMGTWTLLEQAQRRNLWRTVIIGLGLAAAGGIVQRVLMGSGRGTLIERLAEWQGAGIVDDTSLRIYPIQALADIVYLPFNMAAVLFFPLPQDIIKLHYLPAVIESIALLAACAWICLSCLSKRGNLRDPFVVFLLAYIVIFAAAFSFLVGNPNNAVRMRIMVIPAVFLLAAGVRQRPIAG